MSYIEGLLKDKNPAAELRRLLSLLEKYKLRGEVAVDISLVRGLDYYTGLVFEFKDRTGTVKASLGGGGRYDNLIGLYSQKSMPAVGASLGINRIMDVMNSSASIKKSFSSVYVAYIKDKNYDYALQVATFLRANGINTDINTAKRNITNQFVYADSIKFKYAVIVGDAEEKAANVKIRNLVSGEEMSMKMDEMLEHFKSQSGA